MKDNIRLDGEDLVVAQFLRRRATREGEAARAAKEKTDAAMDSLGALLVLTMILAIIAMIAAEQFGWWGGSHAATVRTVGYQDRTGGTTDSQGN